MIILSQFNDKLQGKIKGGFDRMLQISAIKQEEQQTPSIFPNEVVFKEQQSQNFILQRQYEQNIIDKFYYSLERLLNAQCKEKNSQIPKYPFAIEVPLGYILVHLGNHKVQRMYEQQPILCQQQQPIPQIKNTIQKRKGISTKEQRDSKNIPKNYCKAIITFASKNRELCKQILGDEFKTARFIDHLSNQKKKPLNIKVFSSLMQQCEESIQDEFNRTFRIIRYLQFYQNENSQIFVRKYAINYIFNSKIIQHNWHISYRKQIYKGIKNPKKFSHIKHF